MEDTKADALKALTKVEARFVSLSMAHAQLADHLVTTARAHRAAAEEIERASDHLYAMKQEIEG